MKLQPLEPGAPLDLAEARNAVALARFAAPIAIPTRRSLRPRQLMTTAEQTRERKAGGKRIMMPARQAVQTAEDARLIALQKQEEEYVGAERAPVNSVRAWRWKRAGAEETARRQADPTAERGCRARGRGTRPRRRRTSG